MNKSTKDPKENSRENTRQPLPSDKQQQDREHGEGNYKAAREYDRATEQFAKSGKVEPAARAAHPRTNQEAEDMTNAEAEGKSRSKGEDPALHKHHR